MRLLYVASGIPLPGTLGGSTHTLEVARGLAARGHTVHVIACSAEGRLDPAALHHPRSTRHAGFTLHHLDLPKALSLLSLRPIARLARAVAPDVVIERYYNFAGAGLLAARDLAIPALLEVNALIVDPPAVRKRRIDDRLGGPLRRWALAQCRMAARIVTPLHTTVPPEIDRARIVELPWGANVERFAPAPQPAGPPTVLFLGSFRSWHGALDVVRAALLLLGQGRDCAFLLIGDGPQRAAAERLAAPYADRIRFTGAVPYDDVPALLARGAVGVAPFDTAAHPALQAAGFFWSPLKVYEYMAAGLPVVVPDIAPLNVVIRDGCEGRLYPERDVAALAQAIGELLDNPPAARAMGAQGRARVVAHYSWARHCAELERILGELAQQGAP